MLNILLIFLLSFSLRAEVRPSFLLGFLEYPPHIYTDNGEIKGELLSKVLELEKKYSINLELIGIPEGRIKESINSKKIDGFLTLVRTPARQKYLDFTNIDILTTAPQLCSLKSFDYTNLNKFIKTANREMRILIPMSKLLSGMFKSFSNKTRFNYEGNFQKRAITMLKKERIDMVFFPDLTEGNTLFCHEVFPQKVILKLAISKNNRKLHSVFRSNL